MPDMNRPGDEDRRPRQSHPTREERERSKREERVDEGLECLYVLREEGRARVPEFLDACPEPEPESLLKELEDGGWLYRRSGRLEFTVEGEMRARTILRRHRLAEALFHDVLNMSDEDIETGACAFEHLLSEEATQRVCSFLSHPTTCPHGRPIPPGTCCRIFNGENQETAMVVPLRDLSVGQAGQIIFMSPGPRRRLAHLMRYGVVPQAILKLLQRQPSILIRVGETELAIDDDVAGQIFVVPAGAEGELAGDPQATRGWDLLRRLRRRGR
ncbi:MAG: DtxR family transcriptional regulator [Candidatus Eisenbacteria bacterium]|nr:DtxR family transcriptional regulator [Candidatus Eisenbacteria bacterium]